MKKVEINGSFYNKNIDLINSLGLINAWCLINRIEGNVNNINDIIQLLNSANIKAKEEIATKEINLTENNFDGYYQRSYEQACETWSTIGMDLDKIKNI